MHNISNKKEKLISQFKQEWINSNGENPFCGSQPGCRRHMKEKEYKSNYERG